MNNVFHNYIFIYYRNNHKCNIGTVRTQFVTTHNSVGFACKKVQTIAFIERGFERLGLSHQTVGFSWCSYMI